MDIQLKESISADAFLKKMNSAMPVGMRFTAACEADEKVPKIGKMIDCAKFETHFYGDDLSVLLKKINDFFAGTEIVIERHSKKGASFTDVKPWIYYYSTEATDENSVKLVTVQSLCEQMSIRIDDVAAAVMNFADGAAESFSTVKIDTLLRYNGDFISPVDYARMAVNGEI